MGFGPVLSCSIFPEDAGDTHFCGLTEQHPEHDFF